MNQCERIARNMAKRKARAAHKNRHPIGLNAWVNTHYLDYMGIASVAIATSGHRNHANHGRGLLHSLKVFFADLTHGGW